MESFGALLPQLQLGQILIGVAIGFFLARQFPKLLPDLGNLFKGFSGGDAVVGKLDEVIKKLDELKK